MFHGCFSCLSSLFLLISVFLLVSCDLNDRERRHNDNSNNSQVESKRQALTALGPLDDGVVLAGFDGLFISLFTGKKI
jgi:hypothetical protein